MAFENAAGTSLDGNKAEAARILGIDRRTLYSKLRALREGLVNTEKTKGNPDITD